MFSALPSIFAASGFEGLMYVVRMLADWVVTLAPFIVLAAFAYAAMLWVFSGGNPKMVRKARDQFQRALIGFAVIAGYFLVKGTIVGLSIGGF